ncbi:putative SNF2-like domain superfamily protein [Arabidopsis thaliana]
MFPIAIHLSSGTKTALVVLAHLSIELSLDHFPSHLHKNYRKPHHIEILNFLCNNLVVENPNECILAQARGSEKTYLMINFIYGYLEKHSNSKHVFVLPK